MKFFIALLVLASLCHADEYHNLQAARSMNYGEVPATAQESSNPHDFQYDENQFPGDLHRVRREAGYDNGNYYNQDGSRYNPFLTNQQYANQQYAKQQHANQQYAGYGSNNRLLHEFIHDSNFRAQLQAYAQAYYPHTKDTYGPGQDYQSNLYNLYQKYSSSTR